MGRTQQRARWPMAAQVALKLSASVTAAGAGTVCQQFEAGATRQSLQLTVSAVEVGDAEDISGTALRSAVEAGAGDIGHLALHHLGRKSDGEGGTEGGNGGDGELHFGGCLLAARMCLRVEAELKCGCECV
jgi:hypothetical protein